MSSTNIHIRSGITVDAYIFLNDSSVLYLDKAVHIFTKVT